MNFDETTERPIKNEKINESSTSTNRKEAEPKNKKQSNT